MTTTESTAGSWWAKVESDDFAQITLYRVNGSTEELLERVTVTRETCPSLEDFQLMVKEQHGGGIYTAVQRTPQGAYAMRERFAIAGFPKRAAQDPQNEPAKAPDLLQILVQMQDAADKRTERMIAALAERGAPAPAADPLETVERVASILNKTGAAPQPQKGVLELLQEIRAGAELMGLTGPRDPDEGGSWVRDLIEGFSPLITKAIDAGQPAATAEPLPAPTPAPAAKPDGQAAMMRKLKLLLGGMVELAAHAVPPESTVKRIREQAGAEWPVLQGVIAREDAVALAGQLVPGVRKHAAWFEQWRTAVLTGAEEQEATNDGETAGQQAPGPRKGAAGTGKGGSRKRAGGNA